MLGWLALCVSMGALLACGASEGDPRLAAPASDRGASEAEASEELPLLPDLPVAFATFVDRATGFTTDAVFDADRQVVHFDTGRGAMIEAATGEAVRGWSVADTELDWTGSGVAFRVRFGTEGGERRAYFTERGPGTICNLRFAGAGTLIISGTALVPPSP
jgi:hypothetical protein